MDSTLALPIGFVPSLEALPLVAEASNMPGWAMQASPSYGHIIRQMFARKFAAGLVPLDVFVGELVGRIAIADHWCVPVTMRACPIELVMSLRMIKQLQQEGRGKAFSGEKKIVIGIESRYSLTKHQFVAWQTKRMGIESLKVSFKMLPMELMHKGLVAETLDGFLLPSPWGLEAESMGDCRLVSDFAQGKFTQQLVLVVRRDAVESQADMWRQLPAKLSAHRLAQLRDEQVFLQAVELMESLGRPRCDAARYLHSAQRHLASATLGEDDFRPDEVWLEREVGKIAMLIPAVAQGDSWRSLCAALLVSSEGESRSRFEMKQSKARL